jgi:hypothetical protein
MIAGIRQQAPGKSKKPKLVVCALWATLFALCSSAAAQQTGKVLRIGFLNANSASGIAGLLAAFWQEMGKLGWIEGKNITVDYRFAEQKFERLPELAVDLVRLSWRDNDDYHSTVFLGKKADRRACRQISAPCYLLSDGVCR